MSPCKALWVFALIVCLCNALPSVPIATDPILTTETVPTVLPSLVTIYSVVPATDDPNAIATVTTTVNGRETILTTAGGVIAGSATSTIISTLSLTTSQVVVNTVGYSTVFGPDPTTPTTDPIVAPAATTSTPVTAPTTPSVTSNGALTTLTGPSVTSSIGDTTVSLGSLTSTSAKPSPASPTAVGASGSTSSSPKGLSTGAKVGIGIGVAVGVILLALLSFFLGQRYSRRRNGYASNTDNDPNAVAAEEKDTFQAGHPYELTGSKHHPSDISTGKGHQYSRTTTEVGSGTESMSGKSYDMTTSGSPTNHNETEELSALPQLRDDGPMYIGVPSHMSGSKRWSMKEYEK
ncbi:uncharacterized protein Z518_09853 [Rhinocladiella mackenziei CBS 650.93]|uniref:Mid2 domain-containing protein n=1 Tax=Rhinocladiella mackenziei CBS 650.93 TaxID=1442369 RepID=A0A0D2GR39_9EURO|nr:uncharacterized protein Z518_09853 [Rhinocladiella mackenziei CBS 650.93]KIX00788.1 hypothetical protein Z518_09853 [Rhinocladiella mackenziei CBS 650.93]